MTSKLSFVPEIKSYEQIRAEMKKDLEYRLNSRKEKTSLGRPLYYRINVQIVMTRECPFKCPFCLDRQNPMSGKNNFSKQLESLKKVLEEHPEARLSITGGEPSLYPEHVKNLSDTYKKYSKNVFISINSAGYQTEKLADYGFINRSINPFTPNDYDKYDFDFCYQTILNDEEMTVGNIKKIMDDNKDVKSFSFRFLTDISKSEYNYQIFNEVEKDEEMKVSTFRIGDFFVYLTFDYKDQHARITLGDMNQQIKNDYKDGYSNIIIHPDGRIKTNWK